MRSLILEMREESGWADSDSHYEFPARYLGQFEEALAEGPAVALIYEPKRAGGRKAYVAWTEIVAAPERVRGTGHYRVAFDRGLRSFSSPVPFEIGGLPVEHRLREISRTRYGAALQGRAVRLIPMPNAVEILTLGCSDATRTRVYDVGPADAPALSVNERARRVVQIIDRDSRFRDLIMRNGGFRCAVTGFGIGAAPASRLSGIVEAAHIKPVSAQGPDVAENGLALTPTVHRLFDAGLFTLHFHRSRLTVLRSPQLSDSMLSGPRSRIVIENGMELDSAGIGLGPPTRDFIRYHRDCIFRRHAS